jgi:DNA-directed RNA polymerase subunit RPC12/RpoP
MRWRQTFMAEVFESLQQLGLTACPVCGSPESLEMSPFPVVLIDGDFPPEAEALTAEEARGDMTFAVRVECGTCGHLTLFNAQKFRTGDEKIIEGRISS